MEFYLRIKWDEADIVPGTTITRLSKFKIAVPDNIGPDAMLTATNSPDKVESQATLYGIVCLNTGYVIHDFADVTSIMRYLTTNHYIPSKMMSALPSGVSVSALHTFHPAISSPSDSDLEQLHETV